MHHFCFLFFWLASSSLQTPHFIGDTELVTRLTQINAMKPEDISFFVILSAGDSYYSLASKYDHRTLDFHTFIRGVELFIIRQDNTPSYSVQHKKFLVTMLEDVMDKENNRNLIGFRNDKQLDKLYSDLKNLADLKDKETPLTKLLTARNKGIRFISESSDVLEMRKTLDRLTRKMPYPLGLLHKLYKYLNSATFIVPDYDTAEETEDALLFAFRYFSDLHYTQEQVLVLYVYVCIARLSHRIEDEKEKKSIVQSVKVAIRMIMNRFQFPARRLLVGFLIDYLIGEYPGFEKFHKAYNFSKEETALIHNAVINRSLPSSNGPYTILEDLVCQLIGCKERDDVILDILRKQEWDRFCPDVHLGRREEGNKK
jgi:hypothetical protein